MIRYKILILTIIMTMSFNLAYCNTCIEPDKGFRNNSAGRGWFWNQQVCEPVKSYTEPNTVDNLTNQNIDSKNKDEWTLLPEKANIPWELLDSLDPDEIAETIEPEAKKVALMYPTDENIIAYNRLHKWITNKSRVFMERTIQVQRENPVMFKEKMLRATSEFNRRAVMEARDDMKMFYLSKYRDTAKLVIYVRQGCSFCEKQLPIMQAFSQSYGWDILVRDVEKEAQESILLNVELTPDIFLMLKNSSGDISYQRIATGLTTLIGLEDAVLDGLKYQGENIDINNIFNK